MKLKQRFGPASFVALITASLGGACIEVPSSNTPPMCVDVSDCNASAGEICDEGVCWGDPPEGLFAVLVGSPANRPDLATSETTGPTIAANGWFSVNLETPVQLSGRITAVCGADGGSTQGTCATGQSIAAQVVVTRAPRIDGGPAYRAVTQSTAGLATGASFSLPVPRSLPGEKYTVTVYPNRDPLVAGVAAPPERRELELGENVDNLDVVVGAAQLRRLVGDVAGSLGDRRDIKVVARGRWTSDSPIEELSTVAYTDEVGHFELVLPAGLGSSTVDVVASAPAERNLPVLRLDNVPLSDEGVTLAGLMLMPALSTPRLLLVTVMGDSRVGGNMAIGDSHVTLVSRFEADPNALTPRSYAEYSQTVSTDSVGIAGLTVPVGPTQWQSVYELRARPPMVGGSSIFGPVWGVKRDLLSLSQTTLELPARVAISGHVFDADGNVAKGLVVSSSPTVAFASTLSNTDRTMLIESGAGDQVTDGDGLFTLYVDGEVGNYLPSYDLSFIPQSGSLLPRFQVRNLDISSGAPIELGEVTLPSASYVRALVLDNGGLEGEPVSGADVRMFGIGTCDDCAKSAIEVGSAISDDSGVARFVLAR